MSRKLTISIVTPSYNQGSFIEQTYISILSQNLGNRLEYIVMDAKSTDNTLKITKKYISKFKKANIRFKFIREKDKGQSDAINKGWRIAKGDILGYLNSDDYYKSNVLSNVLEYFEKHKNIKWAYGGWNYVNKKGQFYQAIQPNSFNKSKLLNYCNIGQPSCFFRKSLLKEVGFLDENLHLAMDYDLWLRFAERYPAGIILGVISNIRYHQNAKSSRRSTEQLIEAYQLTKKYSKPFSLKRLIRISYFLWGLLGIKLSINIDDRVNKMNDR